MYDYQEYSPDIRLNPWVKDYWTATSFVVSECTPRVFPGDSYVDIIFNIDKTKGIAQTALYGTMTTFVEVVHSSEAMQMFGIRFKPVAITAFTRIAVNEFTDRNVELTLFESLFGKSFYETLPELQSAKEMIAHTNHYLINQLPRLYPADERIIHAANAISHAKGQSNMTNLASEACLCQRHFERRFKTAIGVSPKMFARTIRFNHTLQYMLVFPHKNLLTIAEECGYYDHTHLAVDFKAMSGDIPSVFRQEKASFYEDMWADIYL
jgi:AraC-like DNA-binding protein